MHNEMIMFFRLKLKDQSLKRNNALSRKYYQSLNGITRLVYVYIQ